MATPKRAHSSTEQRELAVGTEELLPLALAVIWLPARSRGKPAHAATLFRWASKGLHGIKLEIVQVGGTKCTSREALHRFFAKLTRATAETPGGGQHA